MGEQYMHTVNVIEMVAHEILQLVAFPDDNVGNMAAERLFREMVRENWDDVDDSEIEDSIDNGYFSKGDYEAYIVHSTNEVRAE